MVRSLGLFSPLPHIGYDSLEGQVDLEHFPVMGSALLIGPDPPHKLRHGDEEPLGFVDKIDYVRS